MIRSPSKIPSQLFFWKKIPKKISFRKWVEYVASHSLLPQNLGSMGGGDVFLTTSAFFQIGKYIKCWIFSICLKLVYQRVVCVFFFLCWILSVTIFECDMAYRVPKVFSLHIFPGQWRTTEGLHIFWVYGTHHVHSLQRQVLRGICKTLPFLLFWSLFSAKHLGPV